MNSLVKKVTYVLLFSAGIGQAQHAVAGEFTQLCESVGGGILQGLSFACDTASSAAGSVKNGVVIVATGVKDGAVSVGRGIKTGVGTLVGGACLFSLPVALGGKYFILRDVLHDHESYKADVLEALKDHQFEQRIEEDQDSESKKVDDKASANKAMKEMQSANNQFCNELHRLSIALDRRCSVVRNRAQLGDIALFVAVPLSAIGAAIIHKIWFKKEADVEKTANNS